MALRAADLARAVAARALSVRRSAFSFSMDTLWLGYDGLNLPFREIAAVLLYQPALDSRIAQTYGSVPRGIMAVIVTEGGAYLPARWPPDLLRRRWALWRTGG